MALRMNWDRVRSDALSRTRAEEDRRAQVRLREANLKAAATKSVRQSVTDRRNHARAQLLRSLDLASNPNAPILLEDILNSMMDRIEELELRLNTFVALDLDDDLTNQPH